MIETVLERQLTPIEPLHEAAQAFWGSEPAAIDTLVGGLVNTTHIVSDPMPRSVLQRVCPAMAETIPDAVTIMQHMHQAGWDVPQPLQTLAGNYSHPSSDKTVWRAMSYVESDGVVPETMTEQRRYQAGLMLGKWHKSLAGLEYQPTHAIPHFHDTGHYAVTLAEQAYKLPDDETRQLAFDALASYATSQKIDTSRGRQLIHGDPKLANMLYRDGQPFTLIDYDTTMVGSVWFDVGDLLRSIASHDAKTGTPPTSETTQQTLVGYRDGAELSMCTGDLMRRGQTAARQIGTELTMRYLSDVINQNYFTWTPESGVSRRDYLFGRAAVQWSVVTALNEEAA